MGRRKRPHVDGAVYHVFTRGNNKQDIFRDDADFQRFVRELSSVQALMPFTLLAYCLMPNHLHLAIRVAQIELGQLMQALLGRYALSFNYRWDRVGHVFQDRFKWRLCLSDDYLVQMVAYIHQNPVKAGLAADAGDWPWSSHVEYLAQPKLCDPTLPLSILGANRSDAVAEYLHRLGEAPEELEFDDEFEVDESSSSPIEQPSLAHLAIEATKELGLSLATLRGSGSSAAVTEARQWFLRQALRAGHRNRDIATFLGLSRARISQLTRSLN